MIRMSTIVLLLILGLSVVTTARQQKTPYGSVVQDMRDREFATIRGDFVAAAELMPAEHYAFKPVETVRSFGEEVAHATAVNFRLCGMASGATSKPAGTPASPATAGPPTRDSLVVSLKSSFDLCAKVLADTTDEMLLKPTTGQYIRASHLTAMLGHNNEVYGKLALMLRMKGLVPPSTARQAPR